MREITLSEQQVEYLEGLREHIAEEHVGRYGHVRMREVVQFLIDRYEAETQVERETVRRVIEDHLADRSYQELQSLAAEVDGVEPGGKAEDLRARLVEARVDELLTDAESDASDASEEVVTADDSPAGPNDMDAAADASTGGSTEANEESTSGNDTAGDEESESGGSRLERMMGLLDRHDDRWEKTDSEEGRYAVTLPDGSVETVRTKDDVRATLFKHYD